MDIHDHKESLAVDLLNDLIGKLGRHGTDKSNQSFGPLSHLVPVAEDALRNEKYKDPLFFVDAPRWLGEWGNTPLEEEIYSVVCELDRLVVEICDGSARVNALRMEHNRKLLSRKT